MKRKHITISTAILLIIAGLTSCGNLFLKAGNNQQPAPVMTGSLNGSVTTSGALPSLLAVKSAENRSAFPGLQFSSGETVYAVKAIPTDTSKDSVSGTFTGNDFVITGLEFGVEYNVTAQLLYSSDNSVMLEGTALPITLTAANPSYTTGQIQLQAKSTASGSGNIYLCINLDDETVSSVTKVVATLQKFTGESFTETQTLSFADASDHSVAIDFSNIPSGARLLSLYFYKSQDSADLLVYCCNEMVNVFDNLTTDWWVKNGAEKHFTDAQETQFVISNTCLDMFVKTSWFVNPDVVTTGTGSQGSPFKTLKEAVSVAKISGQENVSIFLKAGTTNPVDNIVLGSDSDSINHLSLDAYLVTDDARTATITKTSKKSTISVNSGALSVSNITFTNPDELATNVNDNGGFVTIIGSDCSVDFTNCSFQGGKTGSEGGAIRSSSPLELTNCLFNGNSAITGMAVYAENNLTIKSCTFNGNTDGSDHNAVFAKGTVELDGEITFSDDDELELYTPESSESPKSNAQITLAETFCLAPGASAIPLRIEYPDNLNNRQAFSSALEVDRLSYFVLIDDNWIITSTGTIEANLPITVTDGSKTEKYTTLAEAIENLTSFGNEVEIILLSNKSFDLTTLFTITDITVTIKPSNTGLGASINFKNYISISDTGNLIMDNILLGGEEYTNENPGGLIMLLNFNGGTPQATFTNCTFTQGTSKQNGGAINNGGTVTLENCHFSNNKSTQGSGGAICNTGTLTLTACHFDRNSCKQNGGAIYNSGTLTLDYGSFNYQAAQGLGENVYCTASASLTIKNRPSDFSAYIANTSTTTPITLSDDSEKSGTITFATPSAGLQVFTGDGVSSATGFTCGSLGYSFTAEGTLEEASIPDVFVSPEGNDETGDGSLANPYASFYKALKAAESSVDDITIYIEKGHEYSYEIPDDTECTEFISLSSDSIRVTVTACDFTTFTSVTNAYTEPTIIRFTSETSNLRIKQGIITFSGLTFTRNDTSTVEAALSGLVLNDGGDLTFDNCFFTKGKAAKNGGAGAIFQQRGSLTLSNCLFRNNLQNSEYQGGMENSLAVRGGTTTIKKGVSFGTDCITFNGLTPAPAIIIDEPLDGFCGYIQVTNDYGNDYGNDDIHVLNANAGIDPSAHFIYKKIGSETGCWFSREGIWMRPSSGTPTFDSGLIGWKPENMNALNTPFSDAGLDRDFQLVLNLADLSASDVSTIKNTLPHVETLILPAGVSFSANYFNTGKPANLKTVIQKGNITGSWAFQECPELESVILEEGVTSIPLGCYANNYKLKSIYLPSTLTTIGDVAFADTIIEEIYIPASVTYIGHAAFVRDETVAGTYEHSNLDCLKRVIFEDTEHTWTVDGNIVDVSDPENNAILFKTAGYQDKDWQKNN